MTATGVRRDIRDLTADDILLKIIRVRYIRQFSTELLRAGIIKKLGQSRFQPGFEVYPTDAEESGFSAEYLAWRLGDVITGRPRYIQRQRLSRHMRA